MDAGESLLIRSESSAQETATSERYDQAIRNEIWPTAGWCKRRCECTTDGSDALRWPLSGGRGVQLLITAAPTSSASKAGVTALHCLRDMRRRTALVDQALT